MIEILSNTKVYHWYTEGDVCFRGYFQFLGDSYKVYKEKEAIEKIIHIASLEHLKTFLSGIDGCFSIIIRSDDGTYAAVDRARSLPLFYSNNYISDSAEAIREAEGIKKEDVDQDLLLELSSNHFLFGHNTIYGERIKQLDLGEAVFIPQGSGAATHTKYYYHFKSAKDNSLDAIKKSLSETSEKVFLRLKEVIADRPVVLSLSGGYDSRFIACMLKKVGVKDVSCYTYGKKDNHEVIQSKRVAEALGFRWTCVEMTDDLMESQLDEVGLSYIDSYNGHDYSCYFQNFPSVRKLHEEGWFKPGSVFLTGLCGDMPTGAYIKKEQPNVVYDADFVASSIYDMLFNSFSLGADFRSKWIQKIRQEIDNLPLRINDYNTCQSAIDCIYTGSCHAHAYMHMNSAHSFFGYEWLLPYWSVELLDLWYSIPPCIKIGQSLYEDWLLKDICGTYGLGQKKEVVVYTDVKWKRRIMYPMGGLYAFLLLNMGIPVRRRTDFNNFCILELQLYKKLKRKSNIKYMKCGIMHMLGYFTIERRYGCANLLYFKKNSVVRVA